MNGKQAKLWFSESGKPFAGSEPFYFDTAAYPWVAQIEAHWHIIRDELMANLSRDQEVLLPYVNAEMSSQPRKWRTVGLMFWTRRSDQNCRLFPRTWELVKDIPNLTAVSFNLLEPNTTIKPHVGDTNAIIRCHLGIEIPAAAPRCGFRVGSEIRSWENGKFLMFCDAYEHTAWNNSSAQRYIMVIDVMRDEFVKSGPAVASRVLSGIYSDAAFKRRAWLRRYLGGTTGRAVVSTAVRLMCRLSLSFSRRGRLAKAA